MQKGRFGKIIAIIAISICAVLALGMFARGRGTDDDTKSSSTSSSFSNVTGPVVTEYSNTFHKFEWTDWADCAVQSEAQSRYNYRAVATTEGLDINVVQYADNYVETGAVWTEQTHIELQIWNLRLGYGWNGTYLAFFPAGDFYINSTEGLVSNVGYNLTVTDRGADFDGYRYEISYEICLEFLNGISNEDYPEEDPQFNGAPYGYVKFMSYTPLDGEEGYENVTTITKDENRTLWTDDCVSYLVKAEGIVERMYT